LKTVCLSHCRSPISHLFRYASYTGRLRDLRAGIHNGYYCCGCCWSLMGPMAAFGVMNLAAMVALAVEKLSPGGDRFSKAIGVASLAAAVAVIWMPEIAPGLSSEPMVMGG
jgi:predicted metal-binding membrane protein